MPGIETLGQSVTADILPRDFVLVVGSHPTQDAPNMPVPIAQPDLPQSGPRMRPEIFTHQPGGIGHEALIDFVRLQRGGDTLQAACA